MSALSGAGPSLAGHATPFGTVHSRVRESDGQPVLVEVLRAGPYDRLVAAERELQAVQGRHVVPVLEVVRQRSADGAELCAVVRPGFAFTAVPALLPDSSAVRLVADVLLGLADVHAAGQTHGALDARSLLLDTTVPLRSTVRVLGHGLAALLTDARPVPADDVRAAGVLLQRLLGDAVPPALLPVLAELPGLSAPAAAARLLEAGGAAGRTRRSGRPARSPRPGGWVPPPPGGTVAGPS